MSNVLITYESYDPCNQTDTDILSGIMRACNEDSVIIHKLEAQVTKADLEFCDIVIFIRPASINALEIAKAARRAGIFVVSLFDDDLINISKGPHYEHFHWRRNYAKKVLALTTVLIAENDLIISEYVGYMKRPRVALRKNVVVRTDEKWRAVSDADKTLRVIYAAGPDHAHFFNNIVGPAVAPLISRYPDAFDFTFLGVQPDLSLFPKDAKVHLEPLVPYGEFTEFLKKGKFDLGLAPLEDKPFMNRKGAVKYIDYTLVGALGIYSNCLPYTTVIRSGENGILANNTPGDWLSALSFCAEHPTDVKRMAKNAQEDLQKNYRVERVVDELKKDAPEFFGFTRERGKKVSFAKNGFSHALFSWRRKFNEKFLPNLKEKAGNVREQIKERGFFKAIAYYLRNRR